MLKLLTLQDTAAAAAVLRAGGLLAYPTEAVFGLGCNPHDADAVGRLYALKHRDSSRGFLLIAANEEQLAPFVDWSKLNEQQAGAVRRSWPGPTTWILPRASSAPTSVTGAHEGIAVRVTAHVPAVALCLAFGGALVSTSANLHGQPPARTSAAVRSQLGGALLDAVLDGPLGGFLQPTRILDAISGIEVRSA